MDLTQLIAEAWDAEWAQYKVWPHTFGARTEMTRDGVVVFEGVRTECEAHLSRLCARAVSNMLANLPEPVVKTIYDWSDCIEDFEGKQRMFTAIFDDQP